ncbi:MAG: ATP-binding cassette domain-containing protein [Zetaproteobacteria bacterium]|nr:ATP-binding cassette domain-containing protein [Zetaproteobacteria bacterium]
MNLSHKAVPEPIEGSQKNVGHAFDSLCCEHLYLHLSNQIILKDVSFSLPEKGITSLIGPSGAGKSSLLRCITGLNETWQGDIKLNQQRLRQWHGGVDALRKHIGLISQKPSVFPVSIAENVIFGLSRKQRKQNQSRWIQHCLEKAALWDEVKHRLNMPAASLSLGQQQRLCLARALALKPSMLLLDEPTASLDPRSKELIEASLRQLAESMPLLCVTHDLQQTQRLQGQVIFMCDGKIIETGSCGDFFEHPERIETREFLQWSVCDCGD